MSCGPLAAKTQPLHTSSLLHQAKTAQLTAEIKSALKSLDPKALEALVKELQAKNPQMAAMLERLVNSQPAAQQMMTLGEISGKQSAHGSQQQHGGGTSNLAHDLKALLDDIKKKQETTSAGDSAAGAQGNGQHHPPEVLHMAQDVNDVNKGGFQAYALQS